jgi:hypothetical protein
MLIWGVFSMAGPDYAVVELVCEAEALPRLSAIPNLEIQTSPMRMADPGRVKVAGLADVAAQAAAAALGCSVVVVKSAEDYRAQIEDAYRGLGITTDPDR